MKKFLKWTAALLVVVVLVVVGIAIYITRALPNIKLRDVNVERTAASIERGKYLANHVTVCIDCHSKRDWTKFSGPLVAGTEGQGGEIFDQQFGFPGKFVARNISPSGIGAWSDAEIYRAITSGVAKDGHPLFPVMPYPYYSQLDKDDILSIIAYIRTLRPIQNEPEASSADFPISVIMHTIPAEPKHAPRPDTLNKVAYGKYLATAAACMECHTQASRGQIIPEKAYAGGREFPMPFGTLVSANITPDKETGIGKWTKQMFVDRFKSFDPALHQAISVKSDEFNSIMPWSMYAGMTVSDLEAIYAYLQTVPALENKVEKIKTGLR